MTENATTVPESGADTITARVRERYAEAARRVQAGDGCCTVAGGAACCSGGDCSDAISGHLYDAEETAGLPQEAALASLGCGNPTALIDLRAGETVLDLGSGGGLDVLLSAKRVGPSGFVFGLDMTEEMLALAQENKARAGATNVAFLKGRIEAIPLPANSVDVVISNCVINLAADKALVLRDAFRVLKPGGRFAVADVVATGPLPEALRRDMEAWAGCVAGALEIETYRALLAEAGFGEIGIEITRRYSAAEAGLGGSQSADDGQGAADALASAFIRASKPLHPGSARRQPPTKVP